MKKTILLFLIFASVFFIACSNQLNNIPFEETKENTHVKYENGILTYSAKITKPTPCYRINKEEIIMESYPVQVVVDLTLEEPSSDVICIQIIDEETIEGTINIGHKPASFTIQLNGKIIYSTDLKNE